jgi:hypothetical protein
MVRTPGFHPGNRSSILRGITKKLFKSLGRTSGFNYFNSVHRRDAFKILFNMQKPLESGLLVQHFIFKDTSRYPLWSFVGFQLQLHDFLYLKALQQASANYVQLTGTSILYFSVCGFRTLRTAS